MEIFIFIHILLGLLAFITSRTIFNIAKDCVDFFLLKEGNSPPFYSIMYIIFQNIFYRFSLIVT